MRWSWVIFALGACSDPKQSGPDAMPDSSGTMIDSGVDANPNMPATLAETGLCADAACSQINSGIYEFAPRFELWSDSASKKRWIWLPPSTQIDTTDMDFWQFPVGTKLWKEFTRDGTRVETRLVMRTGPGNTVDDWFYAAYVWNQTQDATTWAEFGMPDANGTQHDVPGKFMCRTCHENLAPSRVLGFSAIQLDYPPLGQGVITLGEAIAQGWLSNPPPQGGADGSYFGPMPGGTYEPPALGYMHANCGHCHNPSSQVYTSNTQIQLRLTVATLGNLASTPPYTTVVGQTTQNTVGNNLNVLVDPGQPARSVLFYRFQSTNPSEKMPAVGTEMLDTSAETILRDWITNIQ